MRQTLGKTFALIYKLFLFPFLLIITKSFVGRGGLRDEKEEE